MTTRASDSSFMSWILGISTLITFGLASWSLTRSIDGIEKDAALQEQLRLLQQEVKMMKDDRRAEDKQDATLRKHWKLHTWVRDEIYELRKKNDMPASKWPDFE